MKKQFRVIDTLNWQALSVLPVEAFSLVFVFCHGWNIEGLMVTKEKL